MDTPFHFGILPMLDTAFQLFEENSRGKARTESVLQAMQDGDVILVYGKSADRNISDRLIAMGKPNCKIARPFSEEDFLRLTPGERMRALCQRIQTRSPLGATVHVDHTFVSKWIEASLIDVNHQFRDLVQAVGEHNIHYGNDPKRNSKHVPDAGRPFGAQGEAVNAIPKRRIT